MAVRVEVALAVILAAAGIALLVITYRRRPSPVAVPPEGDLADRRAFLNRALLGALGVFAIVLSGSSLALIWPNVRRGFGSKIVAGKHRDLVAQIQQTGRPVYNTEGKFFVVAYDTSDPNNRYVRAGVAVDGLMALYQKCSHLGCRVPYCPTSGWFECPCHSARFNLAGEVMHGPPPAGLSRFPIKVTSDGEVVVDTRIPLVQPPRGVDTISQQPAGKFCVPD